MKPREKKIDHLVEQYFRYESESGKLYRLLKRRRVNVGSVAGSTSRDNGYVYIHVIFGFYMAHRIAWRLYYGSWPKNQIDHINGNRSDNRICNLREVTPRENHLNRIEHRNGKLPGHTFYKSLNKYRGLIEFNNKQYHLGLFKTEIEAHNQYMKACKALDQREFNSAKELREYIKNMK